MFRGCLIVEVKNKFSFKHLLLSLFCSFILSIGILILISYTFYATGSIPVWVFFVALIGFGYWLYNCQNTKRIWGRTFIGLSIESLALPLAVFIFSVVFASKQAGTIESVGAFIGGGIATIFIGFLSFFFSAIMLIAGVFTLRSAKKEAGKK